MYLSSCTRITNAECRKIKAILLVALLHVAEARQVQQDVRLNFVRATSSASDAGANRGVHDNLHDPKPRGSFVFSGQPRRLQEKEGGLVVKPNRKQFLNRHALNLQGRKAAVTSASSGDSICARNVKLMYMWSGLNALFWGISQGAVFDKYLFTLSGGSNSVVGYCATASGLASLCSTIPVGFLVDRRPGARAGLCKIGSVLGLLATVGMSAAVLSGKLPLIFAALILRGVFYELSMSVTSALFTDSLPKGNRTAAFTKQGIIFTVCGAVGPLLTALAFYVLGDQWSMPDMKTINIAGNCVLPFACLALWFFRDPPQAQAATKTETKQADKSKVGSTSAGDISRKSKGPTYCGCLRPSMVPWILAVSNFINFIGAGMTVRFFNLWWINDEHLTGSEMSWVQTVYPLMGAIFMPFVRWLSKPLGRSQAALLFFGMAIPMLEGLAKFRNIAVLLVLYFLRGGFVFGTFPIQRSILMDFTPSSQRGRWNTLWSLVSTTPLSISSSIAGKIADAHGYQYMFQITAAIYLVGAAVYSPLLALVPRKEGGTLQEGKTETTKRNKAEALEEGKGQAAKAAEGKAAADPKLKGKASMSGSLFRAFSLSKLLR